MVKCKGSKEDGSVCGRPTMYKSDYCKNHRELDPSITICLGKKGENKPCTREAMTGFLFCRAHRTQLADIEKLQCPRGCGQLTLRLSNNSMYFHCRKCKGALLDAKMLETKLSERAGMLNELLENGEECSLRCPRCEGLMLEIRVVYEMPKGGGGGFGNLGSNVDHPGALVGILLIVVVFAVISAAAESKKKRSEDENDEFTGPNMIIDGCRDCGTFWFDADEMNIVKQSLSLTGTTKEELASIEAEIVESVERKEESRVEGRSTNTHCLHIDKRNGKNCRRVTYRSTEYCYMHQPK